MKYFAPIFVWYTAVFLHVILTLNVKEVRTQHVQNVKKIYFCYDVGPGDVNMKHVEGYRLKGDILKILKTVGRILCVLSCAHETCCRSVNFKRNSTQTGEIGDCELLYDVKTSSSSELEKHEMYKHIPLFDPRKEYNICCKICNGSGTFRRESGTCYCTPTDNSKGYVKVISKCVPNLCHENTTCENNGDSFVCLCKKGYVAALKNVALNKVTKQSSPRTDPYWVDSRFAVDGNKNTDLSRSTSCSQTCRTTSPWWMVDLGEEYNVHHLNITNRGDCCYERLSNFEIRIGNFQADNTPQNPKCGGSHSLGKGETRKIVCPAPMKGRYVFIRLPEKNEFLALCEVEVYAEYLGAMKKCI